MAHYGKKSKGFIVGQSYTFARLKSVFGIAGHPFLQVKNGVVDCLCLRPEEQPNLPEEVWVPEGRSMSAAMTAIQKKKPFPVFVQRGEDDWEFIGDFSPVRLVRDGAKLERARAQSENIEAIFVLKAVSDEETEDT